MRSVCVVCVRGYRYRRRRNGRTTAARRQTYTNTHAHSHTHIHTHTHCTLVHCAEGIDHANHGDGDCAHVAHCLVRVLEASEQRRQKL